MSDEQTTPVVAPEDMRIDERVERNAITGEVEYRSWTDGNGILHEEYPELELTDEQRARLDRFTGDLFMDVEEYSKQRLAQTERRRASRAKKKSGDAASSGDETAE